MVVEFHSITGIVRSVNSADKLMKEHCFPRDWPLMKPSWPSRILPQESKDMMYCSDRAFSVKIKEELRGDKALSIAGSVVAEHTHLSHFRAYIW